MKKFDVINYSNKIDKWKSIKKKIEQNLVYATDLQNYLIKQIATNLKNFDRLYLLNNGLKIFGINTFIEDKNNKHIEKLSIEFISILDIPKHEIVFVNGSYNKSKLKNQFISLLVDLSFFIGASKLLISHTEIVIKLLSGIEMNKGFANLTKLKFVEEIKNQLKDIKNEFINSVEVNIKLKKQIGTINQYFLEWESEIISMPKGERKIFYCNEFIKKHPELKNYSYKNFSDNYRKDKSNRTKALKKMR